MSTNVLEFLIVGKEQVSGAMEKVEQKLDSVHGKLDGLKVVGGLALAGAAAAATDFASKSVDAYEEAQKSQAELQEAYKKFPNIADVSIEKLQELNDKIQEKTGYDHNELASAQAKLAMYGLTGKQLEELTPLVADYAAKTGQDLATAAGSVAKAFVGQGRALAEVGIHYTNTKTIAGNYAEVVDGLKAKVEGAADTMGGTAAGKAKILAEGFKDIQEKVGQGLMPVLEGLVDVGMKVVDWINQNVTWLGPLAAILGAVAVAIGVVTAVQWLWNFAMDANPIGRIIIGIAVLIAIIILLVANWNNIVKWLTSVWDGFIHWIVGVLTGFMAWWNDLWAKIGNFLIDLWQNKIVGGVVNLWNGFWGWIVGVFVGFDVWISGIWSKIWNGALGIVKDVWNGIADWIAGGINNVIHIINGITGAVNSVGGAVGIHIGKIPDVSLPHLATGGYVSQGGLAMVGEQGAEVVRLPAGSQVFPNGTQPSGGGLHIGTFVAQANQTPAEIAQELGWMQRWAT